MSESAYLKAAFEGDVEAVRRHLDDGADLDAVDKRGMSALMLAIWEAGHRDVVELLLERGADLTLRQPSSDWSATTFAAVNGHPEILERLLESGASLDGEAKALVFAVTYRSHDTIPILLREGADVNAIEEKKGQTSLMRAAKNSDPRALGMLLEAGADVEAADREGRTALMFACEKANADNVKALLEAGADRHRTDHAGRSALEVAREKGRKKILAVIEEANPPSSR